MAHQKLSRRVFGGVCIALMASCGSGAQPPSRVPYVSTSATNVRGAEGSPCIKQADGPATASDTIPKTLLYVSLSTRVCAYAYPVGRLHEPLTIGGFELANGLCSDSAGNLFVVDKEASDVVEFTHGSTTPLQTLTQPHGEELYECSSDPRTGDLAVTSVGTESDSHGYVVVFPHASGMGKVYSSSQFTSVLYCAYDDQGDLLVAGVYNGGSSNVPEFAELTFGSRALKPVQMNQHFDQYPGDVQWDGKYWAVGNGNPTDEVIYRFVISKGIGTKVGSTHLRNISGTQAFTIYGRNVLMPSYGGSFNYGVDFFKYPAGGQPFKQITKGIFEPTSLAVSSIEGTRRR